MDDNKQLQLLLEGLAQGCCNSVNDVVDHLVTLAENTANKVVNSYIYLKPFEEDIRAEAMLTLVTFVNDKLGVAGLEAKSFGRQLAGAIKNKAIDWHLNNECTVQIPLTSKRRHGLYLNRVKLAESHVVTGCDDVFNDFWISELINELTDEEINLLVMKMSRASLREMSEESGLTIREINITLNQLSVKFKGSL